MLNEDLVDLLKAVQQTRLPKELRLKVTKAIKELERPEDPNTKPFKITSVARDDVKQKYPAHLVDLMDDMDMESLARKMADDYVSQMFWDQVEILAEYRIHDIEADLIKEACDADLPTMIGKIHFDDNKALLEERLKQCRKKDS